MVTKTRQLIKITKNYQITLPVKLREGLRLKEGDYLEADVKDGIFFFKPKKMIDIGPDQAWFWDEDWQEGERQASKDIKNGNVKSFGSIDDFEKELKALGKLQELKLS